MNRRKQRPAPDLEFRETASWFSGWWYGIAVGFVNGIGAAALVFKSGML